MSSSDPPMNDIARNVPPVQAPEPRPLRTFDEYQWREAPAPTSQPQPVPGVEVDPITGVPKRPLRGWDQVIWKK